MEIALYKSPWRAIKILLICSVFVFGGIFLLTQPGAPKLLGWFTIVFFGLGYPVAIFHLLDRRPQIVINEFGIFDRTTYKDFINWEVIRDAYPLDISGQKYVCLVVDEKYEPSYTRKGLSRSAARLAKKIGAQELNIWLGQINIDERKLTEFILSAISVPGPNRHETLRAFLAIAPEMN